MRVISGSRALQPFQVERSAVGIGIFDGVHRGHQSLLNQVVALHRAHGVEAVAYTFHPHPARVLAPQFAPRLVQPLEERLARLEQVGITTAIVEPFDPAFADMSPESYVEDVLVHGLRAEHVVVGAGFTFGRGQAGNVGLLREVGAKHGVTTHAMEHVRVDGIVVSSTKIREFVRNGKCTGATLLLGRPFSLSGTVVRGAERGASLGFPTANLHTDNELIPGFGVYVAQARVGANVFDAVVNVGLNPTFGEKSEYSVEAHLLDWEGGALYGQQLSLAFLARLRDERRFAGVDALRAQIEADVQEARKRLEAGLRP